MNGLYTASRRLFYTGIVIVLLTGIFSGAHRPLVSPVWPILILVGTLMAASGRIWCYLIRCHSQQLFAPHHEKAPGLFLQEQARPSPSPSKSAA
jgi:hypothetical protein